MPETRSNRVAGQALAQGLDDRNAAADRRLEEERRAVIASASVASSSPCAASIALLAVTTGRPRASAALTASNATPSAPPISSTKTSISAESGQVDGAAEKDAHRRDRRRGRACGARYRRRARIRVPPARRTRPAAAAEVERGSSRPRRDRRRPSAAALSSRPRSAFRRSDSRPAFAPELRPRINEARTPQP